ncbi:pyrophosphatase [Agrococcus casei]|uniref:pyrophosphatase n=1 Tax=Agrococcus casei TaxID=343512 RepID=UPI003F8E6F2F
MHINETAAQIDEITRRYAEIYGFERTSDWLMLKVQEELGEVADAYLGMTGRQRDKGQGAGGGADARERFALELADAAGLLMALAHNEGVDLERAIDAKWLVWNRREHQRDEDLTDEERAMPGETYRQSD